MASRPPKQVGAALVVLDEVAIRWGGRLRFQGATWTWRRGEQWTILGANGSGKSLLALALLGEAPIARGEMRFHLDAGEGPAEPEPHPGNAIVLVSPHTQRALAAREGTFYQSRWHGGLDEGRRTVRQFLSRQSVEDRNPYEVGPKSSRQPGFQRRRGSLVRQLGLSHLLNRKLIQLSNGEQRKALLVHTLLKKPRLLILDEPYAGLDRGTRARLRTLIRGLMSSGLPVLVITSRPDEIPARTTHLLLVQDHRLVAQGRKRDVLRFIGSLHESANAHSGLGPSRVPLTRPAGTLSPTGGEGRGEGAQVAKRTARQDASSLRSRPAVGNPRSTGNRLAVPTKPGRPTPLVELEDVTVRYGKKPILNGFTWTLRRGENWALLGPNGSGKSTLLSLIQGDNPQAYAHRIRLFGRELQSTQALWEVRQRLSWVSPELHLHHPPQWNCLEVICSGFFNTIGLYQACSRRQRAAARRCLRALGLGRAEALAFGELSFGEQRLLLLGRALVKKPRLLVLDEPCQGLDAAHRRLILEAVDRAVPRTGASLIFVTHHPREMPRCLTHVLELKNGRLTRQGPRGG